MRICKTSLVWSSVGVLMGILMILWMTPPLPDLPHFSDNMPKYELEGVTVTEVIDGDVMWSLTADEAKVFDDQNILFLTHVFGEIYRHNVRYGLVYSERSVVDMGASRIRLIDTDSNFVLGDVALDVRSPDVTIDSAKRELVGVGASVISSDQFRLAGTRFRMAFDEQWVRVSGTPRIEVY